MKIQLKVRDIHLNREITKDQNHSLKTFLYGTSSQRRFSFDLKVVYLRAFLFSSLNPK